LCGENSKRKYREGKTYEPSEEEKEKKRKDLRKKTWLRNRIRGKKRRKLRKSSSNTVVSKIYEN
jgi:hypothetical protein